MLNLYLILTPLFASIIILALFCLKLALQQPENTIKYEFYLNENISSNSFSTLKYLLKNLTLAELFFVQKSKNKLPLLLGLVIISIGNLFLPSMFIYCGVVILLSLIMLCAQIIVFQHNKQNEIIRKSKYIYLLYASLTIILNLFLLSIIYKNYFNSILTIFIINTTINLVINIFLVGPLICLLIFIPFSRFRIVCDYIYYQNMKITFIKTEVLKKFQTIQGQNQSFEEFKNHKMDQRIKTENLNSMIEKQNHNSSYLAAIKTVERIKKERKQIQTIINPLNQNNNNFGQLSISSINETPVNSNKNNNLSPVNRNNRIIIQQNSQKNRSNKLKKYQHPAQPQINISHTMSIQKSEEISEQVQNPLVSDLVIEILEKSVIHPESHINQQPINSAPFGNKEEENGEIEQIDLNSPQKKWKLQKVEEQSYSPIQQKKKKRKSMDNRKRVLKFTSGEPYLEYLPNMLNKQDKSKRSQPLDKKAQRYDQLRSMKKLKNKDPTVHEQNENQIPQFIIEEL